MFYNADDLPGRELLPGIKMKVLTHGDNTLLCEFHLAAGAVIPAHNQITRKSRAAILSLESCAFSVTKASLLWKLGVGGHSAAASAMASRCWQTVLRSRFFRRYARTICPDRCFNVACAV